MINNSNNSDNKQQTEYLDLMTFLQFALNHKKLLATGLVIGALIGWAVSSFVIHPKYSSYVDLYVTNNKKAEIGSVDYNDINAAQKLAGTYVVILQSNEVTQEVLLRLNSEMTSEQLLSMTKFTSVQNTEVLRISVETKDPQLTKDICGAYMNVAQTALDSVVGAGSVKVISKPELPEKPSFPSIPQFTAIGAMLGLLMMAALSLKSMGVNRPISDDDMLTERYALPVLGTVPDFFQFSKALKISKQDIKKNQKLKAKNPNNEKIITSATILSDNTPFPIREAYNGIRSNILFSLANMDNGIILVSSPNANELKTTTSINLSISIAHIGAKVLLIDCDLRNPSIYKQFRVSNKKGISSVITGFDSFEDSLVRNIVPGVDFLSAGPSTPRPSELLGSSSMLEFLKRQALNYDFVILDTSPLNVVSDSLAFSSLAAGMILVARQNRTIIKDIDRAINSVKMANGQILGFVITDENSFSGGYGYGKYGYGYGYGESGKEKGKAENQNSGSEITMNSSYLNAFRRRKRKILLSEIKEDDSNFAAPNDLSERNDGFESYYQGNNNQYVPERSFRNTAVNSIGYKTVAEPRVYESVEPLGSSFQYGSDDRSASAGARFRKVDRYAAQNTLDRFDSDIEFSDDFSSQTMNPSETESYFSDEAYYPDDSDKIGAISENVAESDQSAVSVKPHSENINTSGKKNAKVFIVLSLIIITLCVVILAVIRNNESDNADPTVPVYSETDGSESSESEESSNDVSSDMGSTTEGTSEVSSETTTTTAEIKVTALSPGTQNDDVLRMQKRLAELGYISNESCTGYYGDYTQKRLKRFQRNAGLKQTGIADVNTLKRLYAEDAPKQ